MALHYGPRTTHALEYYLYSYSCYHSLYGMYNITWLRTRTMSTFTSKPCSTNVGEGTEEWLFRQVVRRQGAGNLVSRGACLISVQKLALPQTQLRLYFTGGQLLVYPSTWRRQRVSTLSQGASLLVKLYWSTPCIVMGPSTPEPNGRALPMSALK